jgi:hypothetical protein
LRPPHPAVPATFYRVGIREFGSFIAEAVSCPRLYRSPFRPSIR